MKPLIYFSLIIVFLQSSYTQELSYNKTPYGIEFEVNGYTRQVTFYDYNTVRVQTLGSNQKIVDSSLVVVATPKRLSFVIKNGNKLIVETDSLQLYINKRTGAIEFFDKNGITYTKEHETLLPVLKDTTILGKHYYQIKQTFKLSKNEGLYGLGQFEEAYMNYRGETLVLAQSNKTSVVPMMTSTNNYGILWDNYSRTIFSDTSESTSFSSEVGDQIDYYFIAGNNIDDVISGYRELTGPAPLFSKKAYGFWQSKERYKTFDELHQVVQKYRDNNIPLDNIIQDWQYWGEKEKFSSMYFDPNRFGHPKENIEKLHNNNIDIMVSIWPAIGPKAQLAKELDSAGLFLEQGHWSGSRVYDAYSAKARNIYWKHIKRGLFDNGIDGFWMDGTEPEFFSSWTQDITSKEILKVKKVAIGPVAKYLNTFALVTSQGLYEKLRGQTDKKRVFILTRSAWAGQQRNATVTWSGDVSSNFKTLKQHISSGINFSMTGIPYWTHDIGGFFSKGSNGQYPKGIEDPAFQELYVRWFQFGAFSPIFRSHGTDTPREVWQFKERNPEFYEALLNTLHLRYQLLPYIYANAWQVTNSGGSFMRGLVMDFPDDSKVYNIKDHYLFGPSFLVKPITKHMYHKPQKLLPVLSSEYLRTADNKEGLNATYFKDTELKEVVHTGIDKQINFNWSGGGLPEDVPDKNFSVRWQGDVIAPENGEYTVGSIADDGVRLWWDNKLIIDEWKPQGATLYTHKTTMKKGKRYPIKLEYYQGGGSATINLGWKKPGLSYNSTAVLKKKDSVYLPNNSGWYDFWTNEYYEGGQTITKQFPIAVFPLFVKAGSIIPFGPKQQYVDEKPNAPIQIRIYTGQDANFTYYEDEGNTYNYEKGDYNTIAFAWDDAQRELSIGESKGSFNGHFKNKTFQITIIGASSNQEAQDKRLFYEGNALELRFK